MESILQTIIPAFSLIMIGYVFKQKGFPGDDFWLPAEKFTYFLLLPMLFFKNTITADFSKVEHIFTLGVAIASGMFITSIFPFLLRKPLGLDAKQFGSFYQGSIRFNNYVGIPVIVSMQGNQGLLIYAIVIAVSVPLSNILTVAVLTHYCSGSKFSFGKVLHQIIRNPLIIACFAGIAGNLLGIKLGYALELVRIFADASLAFGLVTVGAGMTLKSFKKDTFILIANAVVKLAINPLVLFGMCTLFGITGDERTVATVYGALPVAASSYVLTKQLKASTELITSIIAFTTLASGIALSVVMYLLH